MFPKLTLVLLGGWLIGAVAAEPTAEEYHVKGAYLLNFAKFVEWPEQTFKAPGDPIVICVVGPNPFGPGLEKAAQATVVANRPVTVRQISDGQQAGQCQIAFVTASERKLTRSLLQAVQGASVLTVGESDNFISNGGVVGFKVDGDKVRIEINTEAADRAKLRISAKLLSLAQAGKK
jgi:hypothetical protein